MQVIDASSALYAWDNYPESQFPGFWKWLSEEINQEKIVIPNVALTEVKNKYEECANWLRNNGIKVIKNSNLILQEAKRIKGLLNINDENYHPNGVDENDLIIIATAKILRYRLISDEKQPTAPNVIRKRKIPKVCIMDTVNIDCICFVDFFKESGVVFR